MDIREIKDKKLRELALKRKEEQGGTIFELWDIDCFDFGETKEGGNFWKDVLYGKITSLSNNTIDDEFAGYGGRRWINTFTKTPSIEVVNQAISDYLDEFKKELIQKNLDYNNSIYKPNIFGQDPMEGIKARISDKINRVISKGLDDKTEDSMEDLMGYHVHRKVYQKLMRK